MPLSSITEMIPMEPLSHIDRRIFAMSSHSESSFEACGLNAIDLSKEDKWSGPGNALLNDGQCSLVGFLEDTTLERPVSPSKTLDLCDTPMSLSTVSVIPAGYLANTQSCHDTPDFVEMSRTSSESSWTWESGLDVPFMPASTTEHLTAVDQRCACPGHNHPFRNTHDRVDHAKRISQTAWKCLEPECGKSYSRRDSFLRHQHAHRVDSHPCKICSREKKQKSFKRKDHLKEHVRKCHSGRGDNDMWSLRGSLHQSGLDCSAFAVDVGMGSQKQQAVRAFVETLGYVLGDHVSKFDFGDLGEKMAALSESDMKSVVGSMASVGATMAQTILSATTGLDHPAPESGSVL